MSAMKPTKTLDQIIAENKDVKGTVLIVDDNDDIVDITKASLQRFTRFKVLTAANGREALEVLFHNSVDVIILDDHMPEMSGVEFFRIIRQRSIYVPVIFLTGKPNDQARQQQLSLGAFDYLEKPVKARDLLVLVMEAVKVMDRIRAILERRA
ncbi:response regulator transcription factor [Oligoflexus tunisiensis]|uniref:response regulator transcription factor n=1 Tax=Oligoflexus tunisiensis TaxID=708132 RepID=UPI00114D1A25|nr:response regulator [Oligoflexus tunisiensis]